MSQTSLLIIAPGVNPALSEHSLEQLLPSRSILLNDRLVWDSEGGAHESGPVGGIVQELGCVKCFAGRCEVQEAGDI